MSFRPPVLFKKSSTGALQQWTITTQGAAIITEWGQVGGAIQTTTDIIAAGKNIGRSNETTPEQQAESEAQSRWEKQLKKGYVQTREDAEAGRTDAVIEGGVFPMLAHKFSEQGHKIEFPALVQPKFDGHRCIATVDDDGKVGLWSRTRKPITGVPHINRALEKLVVLTGCLGPFDGELYNHDYKDNFEDLTSFIRQEVPKPGHEVVQYHIYDLATDGNQSRRSVTLNSIFQKVPVGGCLVQVETREVADEDELMAAFDGFLAAGYEGAMVRNLAGLYVNKRSKDLQKVKEFQDAEFVVTGVVEGRGKLAGHAIFVCETEDGTEFQAKMKGKTEDLKQYWLNPDLAIGRMLTVKYQGITKANGVPRFPVALRFRTDV